MRILLIVASICLSASVHATHDGNRNCRGNCPTNGGEGAPTTVTTTVQTAAAAAAGAQSKAASLSQQEQALTDNGVVETNVGIGETTLNVSDSSDYVIPHHAAAGFAMSTMQGCFGIGGTDARGAGSKASGGLTLNLFNLTNGRCVLAAKAMEAKADGNLEAFATYTCAEKAAWGAWQTVTGAMEDRRVSKREAIRVCLTNVVSIGIAMEDRITKIEATQHVYINEGLVERVEFLEGAAHRPKELGLLLPKK